MFGVCILFLFISKHRSLLFPTAILLHTTFTRPFGSIFEVQSSLESLTPFHSLKALYLPGLPPYLNWALISQPPTSPQL